MLSLWQQYDREAMPFILFFRVFVIYKLLSFYLEHLIRNDNIEKIDLIPNIKLDFTS